MFIPVNSGKRTFTLFNRPVTAYMKTFSLSPKHSRSVVVSLVHFVLNVPSATTHDDDSSTAKGGAKDQHSPHAVTPKLETPARVEASAQAHRRLNVRKFIREINIYADQKWFLQTYGKAKLSHWGSPKEIVILRRFDPFATRILLRMSMKWAKKVDDPRFFWISYQDTESDLLKK